MGVDVSALRRYARVSETLRPPEFEALVSRRTTAGLALTWSHLELIARVRSRNRRQAIARLCFEESLSVRGLAAVVERERKQSPNRLRPR